MGDNYRRPKRGGATYIVPTSTSSRRFTSYQAEKSLNQSYGKKIVETIYPQSWKLPVSKREFKSKHSDKGQGNLEKKLGIIAVAFLGGSFAFFTPNLTGNVIWNLPVGKTNIIGAVLFVLGLSGMLFCTRKK